MRPGSTTPSATPALSAIVIARDAANVIERAVRSVVEQDCPEPFEVIVVTSGSDDTAAIVRRNFPDVTVVELDGVALPGRARNAGLQLARGRWISFPGSHVELPQGSIAARLRAHQLGYPLVTGTLVNGTDTVAGWASYFLDNRSVLPGRPSGELRAPPIRCSYLRSALAEVGDFPEYLRTAEDTVVNDELFRRGHRAYRAGELVLVHHTPARTTSRLLRHHFRRGRGAAMALSGEARKRGTYSRKRLLAHVVGGGPARFVLAAIGVARWGSGLRGRFLRSSPLVFCAAMAWWAGLLTALGGGGSSDDRAGG